MSTVIKYSCPFCQSNISLGHYAEHLLKKHEEQVVRTEFNLTRLLKQQDGPWTMLVPMKGKNYESYYTCLGCLHSAKRPSIAQHHFPKCQEEHKKMCGILYQKYKDPATAPDTPVVSAPQPIVNVEGWSNEQVNALLGSLLSHIHNYQRDCEEMKRKVEYYEEKIKDLPEETQEEIEESVPEYPEDDEILFDAPEDITGLWNLSLKMGFKIRNKDISEDFKKWDKMPLKKLPKA